MTEFNEIEEPEPTTEIEALRAQLNDRTMKTKALLATAYSAAWLDLGKIYETAARIEARPEFRQALIDEVDALADADGPQSWDAAARSTFENLLVLASGFDDPDGLRNGDLARLNDAAQSGVPHNEQMFAEWVEERHGPVHPDRDPATPHPIVRILDFSIDPGFMTGRPHIDLEPALNPKTAGLAVALLKRVPGGGSDVIDVSVEIDDVLRTIEAIKSRRAKRKGDDWSRRFLFP